MDGSGSRAPKARPAATYKQVLDGPLLKTIIGGFFGDDHVVDVALPETSRRHAHELSALAQFLNAAAAAVTHSGAQATDELIHQVGQQALVRHAALDAFGNQFSAGRSLLAIAIRRALAHRAERSHAAI